MKKIAYRNEGWKGKIDKKTDRLKDKKGKGQEKGTGENTSKHKEREEQDQQQQKSEKETKRNEIEEGENAAFLTAHSQTTSTRNDLPLSTRSRFLHQNNHDANPPTCSSTQTAFNYFVNPIIRPGGEKIRP